MWFMQYKNTINIYVVYAIQKYNKYMCVIYAMQKYMCG